MSSCHKCAETVIPTGVEDVWMSADSLECECPSGGDHTAETLDYVVTFERGGDSSVPNLRRMGLDDAHALLRLADWKSGRIVQVSTGVTVASA